MAAGGLLLLLLLAFLVWCLPRLPPPPPTEPSPLFEPVADPPTTPGAFPTNLADNVTIESQFKLKLRKKRCPSRHKHQYPAKLRWPDGRPTDLDLRS